jgi:hypothetical protein
VIHRLSGARRARPRRAVATTVLLALATSLLAAPGCGAKGQPRVQLADGNLSLTTPKELRDPVSRGVVTEVRTISGATIGPRERACIRSSDATLPSRQLLVERVDIRGTSITFRLPGQRFVYGCTAAGGLRDREFSWCGHVLGKLRGGRLRDPRLDIGCRDATGGPWGSVWVDPVRGTRWVVVRDREYAQIYPTAVGLPVRVTTGAVDTRTGMALFRVEEYDRTGALISASRLRAAVAG